VVSWFFGVGYGSSNVHLIPHIQDSFSTSFVHLLNSLGPILAASTSLGHINGLWSKSMKMV